MTNDPDLPIFLSAFKSKWAKIEPVEEKLGKKRYVHIDPPLRGWGEKERRLWDQKYRELNPEHYLYDKRIFEWQKLISKRERKVLFRLREIFNQFECPYLNWEALALKLIEAPAYQSAWPKPAWKLRRVKGRSVAEWRTLALELTLVNELFTVEPLNAKPADRTADMKLAIALMMDARLTPHPETGRQASPSVAQAAKSVYAELIRMAKAGNSTPEEIKEIPHADYIRTLYYRILNSVKKKEKSAEENEKPTEENEKSIKNKRNSKKRGQVDGPIVYLSSRMRKKFQMDQVLSDLERIASHWEYAMKSEND